LFIDYVGAADNAINREIGRKWLPGAVWRQMEPGCPVDYMVVTVGPQGIGKSSLVNVLWGRENVVTVTGEETQKKDNDIKHHICKCLSLEEFDAMSTRDIGKLKGQITNPCDTFREPYGTDTVAHARRGIMYASTNRTKFLKRDDSGYRRFAVVPVKQVNFAALERDREQLWAEAVAVWHEMSRAGILMDLSNIEEVSVVAEQFVHTEGFVTEFEESLDNHLDMNPQWVEAHTIKGTNYLCMRASEVSSMAGLSSRGTEEQRRALHEWLVANGWRYVKESPGGRENRKKKVWIKPRDR
jgi:predicted P-loop ATPase